MDAGWVVSGEYKRGDITNVVERFNKSPGIAQPRLQKRKRDENQRERADPGDDDF